MRMAKAGKAGKAKENKDRWIAASLFLIGLTLLLESLGAGFILSQLPQSILGATGSLIWLYIIVRLVAGIVTLVVGAKWLGKRHH